MTAKAKALQRRVDAERAARYNVPQGAKTSGAQLAYVRDIEYAQRLIARAHRPLSRLTYIGAGSYWVAF